MAIQKFYLLGREASTAVEIPFSPHDTTFRRLKLDVAKALTITRPDSIGFLSEKGDVLDTFESVVDCAEAIRVAIDGHAIRKPAGPPGLPFVGNFYQIYPDHLRNHATILRKYGSVVRTEVMGKVVYLTNDPHVAEVVLVESPYFSKEITVDHPLYGIRNQDALFVGDTNQNWVVGHKFAAASMTGKAIRHYATLTHKELKKLLSVLDELDQKDTAFNAYPLTLRTASQVIGEFTLKRDMHHLDGIDQPLDELVTSIADSLAYNKKVSSRGEWYGRLPFGDAKGLRNANAKFKELLTARIDELQEQYAKEDRPDLPIDDAALEADCLLDFFLRATDSEGKKLPSNLLLANMSTLVGAGFTTTSSAMAWVLYALAIHPECQAKLLQELVDEGINVDTEWTATDAFEKLPYLERFLKETLRMYGPSFQPGRTAQVDCVLPGGYTLKKGEIIIPSLYSIHYHPDLWDNPERFDPDRWTPELLAKRTRYEYMPFAAGGRSCIGFNFALQELRIFLAIITRHFYIERTGDEPVEYDPEYQLIHPTNVFIRARRRKEATSA